MKKLLATLLVLALVTTFLPCLSEDLDYNSMSDGEILVQYEKIMEQMNDRGLTALYDEAAAFGGEPFYNGVYVAGKDIKPGFYNLQIDSDCFRFYYSIYENEESYNLGNGDPIRHGDNVVGDPFIGVAFSLEEGNVLVFSVARGNALIKQSNPSFAP